MRQTGDTCNILEILQNHSDMFVCTVLEGVMSYQTFLSVLKSARLHRDDRTWFARWLDAYRKSCGVGANERVPVERERLIAFLKDEKARGRWAWQRLQIVQAIEFYRNSVLRTGSPDVQDIRDALARVAQQQRDALFWQPD
jgi:hypothetical protein